MFIRMQLSAVYLLQPVRSISSCAVTGVYSSHCVANTQLARSLQLRAHSDGERALSTGAVQSMSAVERIRDPSMTNIFDVAEQCQRLSGAGGDALRRLYTITMGTARCDVGAELATKYSMAQNNEQHVVSVTNNVSI